MPTTTLSPRSSFVTPKYRRTLPVPSVKNCATYAYLIGNPKSQAPAALSSEDYLSDNTSPSGITFLSFWNASSLDNVSLDVGPNGSGALDYGDTILIDSDKAKGVVIRNSSFVTGTANSPVSNDKDLVAFGTSSFKDSQSWNGITGLGVDTRDEVDLLNSTVRTGNDNDTIVFASQNTNSVIQDSTISVGHGADFIHFNWTQSIRGGNKIDLGGGASGDDLRDTIVFATNNFSGVSSASPLIIEGFEDNVDFFRVGSTNYRTQAAVNQAFGSRIVFS